ncbi:hypothetical protein N7492_005917 [Penicillium capsulatum]|uniref:Uncharacterized protein n=1 Tax=Penicillium capsulatum TaxID=69766 RepID=A0A9W9IAC1_9EURO|nr:hypothetical protein N7492_005917 [Penicillium capsulatum]KAJ6134980.1 hypothetical protein N7512_000140 [Penicillium capsulatum]
MYFARYSKPFVVGAQPIRSSIFRSSVLCNGHTRTLTNVPNETPGSVKAPRWFWWVSGGGAVTTLYLWNTGHKNARGAAAQDFEQRHGTNQEYEQKSEENE